jgi:hypothetical protein
MSEAQTSEAKRERRAAKKWWLTLSDEEQDHFLEEHEQDAIRLGIIDPERARRSSDGTAGR